MRGDLVITQRPGLPIMRFGFKSQHRQKFGSIFLLRLHPLANSATMSTLAVQCQWEDETVMEMTRPRK